MQPDAASRPHKHVDHDVDSDSLFGSPPPSPRGRGRSPSPLALPGTVGSAQNVGTLALPGSHMFNELPSVLSPVTCGSSNSPSHPQGLAQHRSSQPPQAVMAWRPATDRSSSVPSASTARASTPAATCLPARVPKTSTKRKANRSEPSSSTSTPRPTPPPISLPDPSDPPPSNFLRSQQALLGLAGLVGGVNPANLALPRGSSANNPIVVDDEDDTPKIGRRPPQNHYPMAAGIPPYPTVLPAPSSNDIIQTLIKQKNVFPVLGALVSILARSAEGQSLWSQYQAQTSGFHRPYVNGPDYVPSAKRRKVNAVPAGASDWDVPYPFQNGEGPANYRTNWEKQRSKQLVEDLIGLVKSAMKKAAAKNYYYKIQQQQALPPPVVDTDPSKVFRHYRPETLRYGLDAGQLPPLPSSVMTMAPAPAAFHASATPYMTPSIPSTLLSPTASPYTSASPTPSLDDLFTSIMTGPTQNESTIPASCSSTAPTSSIPPTPASSSPTLSASASSTTTTALSPPSTPSASASTPASISNDTDFQTNINDFLTMLDDLPQSELSGLFTPSEDMFSASSSSSSSALGSNDGNDADSMDLPESFLASIDPVLLAFDADSRSSSDGKDVAEFIHRANHVAPSLELNTSVEKGSSISTAGTGTNTPTLVGSPLSLDHDEPGPQTPNWDYSFPEPDVAGVSGGNDEEITPATATVTVGRHEGASLGSADLRRFVLTRGLLARSSGDEVVGNGKGKEREVLPELSPIASYPASVERDAGDIVMQDATPGPAPQFTSYAPPPTPTLPHQVQLTTVCHAAPSEMPSQPIPGQHMYAPMPSMRSPIASSSTSPPPAPLPFPLSLAIPILQATQPTSSARPLQLHPVPHQQQHSQQPQPQLSAYKARKQETLRRARAMRAQLMAEIQRAKVELWETAMEGGCLAVLGKEVSKTKS